jgi:fatty acid desaturase
MSTLSSRSSAPDVRGTVLAEDLTARHGGRVLRRALGGVAAYAALGALAVLAGRWEVWLPAWVAMAVVLLGAVAAAHESVHGNLARRPWVGALGGHLAGLLLLVPYESYRAYHLEHHRSTATTDDPEGDTTVPSRLVHLLLPIGGVAFWVELWSHGLATVAGRPPRWVRTPAQRRALRRDVATTMAAVAAAVAAGVAWPVVAALWLAPLAVLFALVLPFVLLPEHHGAWGAARANPVEVTSTVRSNALLRLAFWNTNLHAAHHHQPRVPALALPRLDELVAPLQPEGWRTRSYVAWHRRLWASRSWRAPRA